MSKPIVRRDFMGQAGVAAGAAATLGALGNLGPAHAASPQRAGSPNPDPTHISPRSNGWWLRPTGGDDQPNIEWALKNAPKGGVVKLSSGTFKLSCPAVVADFDGSLIGSGAQRTTMTCTDDLNYEIWESLPGWRRGQEPAPFPGASVNGSLTQVAPSLITFYKTPLKPNESKKSRANRIKIKHIRCRGAMKGVPWMFGDEVLCFNILNSMDWDNPERIEQTTRQDVLVENIVVDGYATPAFGPFGNTCACITILGGIVLTSDYNLRGVVDGNATGAANGGLLGIVPAEGDVTFRSCDFTNCRLGPGVVGYRDGIVRFENMTTNGCRGNCLQALDLYSMRVIIKDCDLFCDSFILPPDFVGGQEGVPSSLGCVVAIQGLSAAVGFAANIQFYALAFDPDKDVETTGPIGTWRPQGPAFAPNEPSQLWIINNDCRSSETANTYCYHLADLTEQLGYNTLRATLKGNSCEGAQTCIGLDFTEGIRLQQNECDSRKVGIELHEARRTVISGNEFSLPADSCKILKLSLGDKPDLSRTLPGAGTCIR